MRVGWGISRWPGMGVFASAVVLLLHACASRPRPVKPAAHYAAIEEKPTSKSGPAEEPAAIDAGPVTVKVDPPVSAPETSFDPVERKLPRLEAFYDALDSLRAGVRQESVRVFWLGDSHTAADFMTHRVRLHLARLGGDGGPGFVRLGLDLYRHGALRLKEYGRWRKAPILPAQRTRVLDGIFGYGGIRTLPAAAAGVNVRLKETRGEPIEWTLAYRLPEGAALEIRLGEQRTRLSSGSEDAAPADEGFASLSGADTDEFSVHHVAGDPQIFGAYADYSTPGVVLDTVGINGARTATALAWEPKQFVEQVERRAPDLLVLAFGTNEVFDQTRTSRYVEHTKELVRLVREARPEIPCWIVGPPDSATTQGSSKARVTLVTEAQRQAADAMGCGFTSAYELMGGEGSYSQWARQRPAKARGDRVHLTILGYRTLGDLLAKALVDATPLSSRDDVDDEAEDATEPASAL